MSTNENPRPLSRRTMLTGGATAIVAGTAPALATAATDRTAYARAFNAYMAATVSDDAAIEAENKAAARLKP